MQSEIEKLAQEISEKKAQLRAMKSAHKAAKKIKNRTREDYPRLVWGLSNQKKGLDTAYVAYEVDRAIRIHLGTHRDINEAKKVANRFHEVFDEGKSRVTAWRTASEPEIQEKNPVIFQSIQSPFHTPELANRPSPLHLQRPRQIPKGYTTFSAHKIRPSNGLSSQKMPDRTSISPLIHRFKTSSLETMSSIPSFLHRGPRE
jgi:hypothetical protein